MSALTDWLTGGQTSAEADANYARQQADFQSKLHASLAGGTVTPDQAARIAANTDQSLNSVDLAAGIGAVQGATEILYDPSQWAADTATGAQMAATGASKAYDAAAAAAGKAYDATTKFAFDQAWAVIKKVLGSIPWWAWLIGAGALFVWMGGLALLRGRLARA